MAKITVGSVCSGIEAASVAWGDFDFKWFSEISTFPSKVLSAKYPRTPNLGDMCLIPDKLRDGSIDAPDLICGGTPCQAFSLAGWKKGLGDDRGNLTLKFVDIIDACDAARHKKRKKPCIVLWENVEGVLRDKTNAFGCLLASLSGLDSELLTQKKWPNAGVIRGPKRNIAWRVLDAKYFGLPQQRRRLYVIAGGIDFYPENILFDKFPKKLPIFKTSLKFKKDGARFEVFRDYTDCLYSAYGTKWNGNAAAYNGSLFVVQNARLRRLTPLECERLMGFPDNYTNLLSARPTNRYQAIGNSWAVPVIRWLGDRITDYKAQKKNVSCLADMPSIRINSLKGDEVAFYPISITSPSSKQTSANVMTLLNGSEIPENPILGNMMDIVDTDAPDNFYITPVGCKGILRRKEERGLSINERLEVVLTRISSKWSEQEIEAISRKQKRGQFSTDKEDREQYAS